MRSDSLSRELAGRLEASMDTTDDEEEGAGNTTDSLVGSFFLRLSSFVEKASLRFSCFVLKLDDSLP